MRALLSCLASVLVLGLGAAAWATDLTVSAAASLTNALRELAPAFEAAHPGTRVQLNFGASGALLQQIAKGAPVDVFASADQETMDQAQAQGLIDSAGRHDFAANALVVIVPEGSRQRPATLAELAQPPYARIAIGLPASVPVGRYTRAVLEREGLWLAIEPKMIGANNVRQALDYTARGEVDAGFVYATDAALMPGRVAVALTVPTATPIRYPVAPVAGGAQAEAARQFIAFLRSAPAQALLARHGFGAP
ncbi:molybdate transport system substrate-binding protein [Plasticicumulans lactativorans]|uniref:Molybdate transport system substrate-binding protein n=1 Tax=Plasticicumulans lactativorans TaxID=1133106 RepID=A0A4R2LHD1_9GAMM|nr:molybdate ABC transporter substrate-binding protein [Plasticicumulans lactativorans]TCO82448.1 molybdate transport system substrate-binding protein [Plasticicumulans lactativorans]